jgi:membrane fusion protein (multidrug efflux system)
LSLLRQILVLLVLVGVGAGGWFLLAAEGPAGVEQPQRSRAIPVQVAEVRPGRVRETVEAVATSRAEEAISIVPTVSGRIQEILFEPRQRVKAGHTLVRLEAEVEQAAVDEAKALLDDARGQYERGQQLARSRSVADARVEELRAGFLAAQARLEGTQKQLADRTIQAPFDGIVGLREVSVGARVDTDTVITTLDALDTLEVEFSVPEQFYGRIQTGTPIVATTSSYAAREFRGEVGTIDSRVDPVARAFRVRAKIPNPDLALPAGMFMVVEAVLAERIALLVPEEAVQMQGRNAYLYRIDGDRAKRVQVQLGQRRYGSVEIRQGVRQGDRVAVTGLQRLRDGSTVEVQNQPFPAVS